MDPIIPNNLLGTPLPAAMDHTTADATVAELLTTLATNANTGSSLGKRSSEGIPSGSSKRTSSTSRSSLDEADSEEDPVDLNAADSDDGAPHIQARLLPPSFFASSHQLIGEKLRMSPIPWVVSPKYSTPIQMSATSETDMFTAFTSSQELIVFKVVGSQANSPKKIFRILARKGSSSYPTYRVDEAFSSAMGDI